MPPTPVAWGYQRLCWASAGERVRLWEDLGHSWEAMCRKGRKQLMCKPLVFRFFYFFPSFLLE